MTKRVALAIVLAAGALALSACGNTGNPETVSTAVTSEAEPAVEPETPDVRQLARVFVEKVSAVESCEQELSLDLDMEIAAQGESIKIQLTSNTLTRFTKDPYVAKAQSTVEVKSGNGDPILASHETYTEKTGENQYIIYNKAGEEEDAGWSKTAVELPDSSTDILDHKLFEAIERGETEAALSPETETVEGKVCFMVETYLSGDETGEAAVTANAILAQFGYPEEMYAEDLFKDIKVPAKYWIDVETGLPVKSEQDMSQAMGRIMNSVINALASSGEGTTGSESASGLPFNIEITSNKCVAQILYRDFNAIGEIVIPEEVRNAETAEY